MFGRFLRKVFRSKNAPVKARSRSWPRFVPSFDWLEGGVSRFCAEALHTFQKLIRPSRPAPGKKQTAPRLGFEQLEYRVVPAAAWTDLLDYHPNSTALITGTGFKVGETVQLQVLHADGTPSPGDAPWFVVDGAAGDRDGKADGNIQTSWYVGLDCAGATLELTARGLTSGAVAQWEFTDRVTVTAASGGTNLAADKAANAASPQYTTLGNIVIAESGNNKGDFAAGSNKTLILTAPSGWAFNPSAGSVSFTSGRDISAASISVTSST